MLPAGVACQKVRFSLLGGLVVTGVRITVAVWVSWLRVFCWQVNLALIIGFIPWWSIKMAVDLGAGQPPLNFITGVS